MTHAYKFLYGALLVLGLAGVTPVPALAGGYYYDAACHCMRPDYQYQTYRTVRAPARVVTRRRIVDHTRVVRGRTRLVQENRLITHVRPVINREVVVHRTNTIVRDVVLHRVNTMNRYRNEYHTQVINRYVPGSVRHVVEWREARGCNYGAYGGGYYSGGYGGGYYSRGYGGGYYSGGYRGRGVVYARD